eukprot:CAMPEP_0179878286 /NCGR_PEP_ID=MMETSP0982-20121206/25275_1 /TAXON_ID=483367 /ORGANISM="non described non described, Strain CCMP 2436" /LENGTH=182 /DNA_ID=CAMNT_0021771007 /DNA_START=97 /DNA_END=646 /DNA_ORIENTATION=-
MSLCARSDILIHGRPTAHVRGQQPSAFHKALFKAHRGPRREAERGGEEDAHAHQECEDVFVLLDEVPEALAQPGVLALIAAVRSASSDFWLSPSSLEVPSDFPPDFPPEFSSEFSSDPPLSAVAPTPGAGAALGSTPTAASVSPASFRMENTSWPGSSGAPSGGRSGGGSSDHLPIFWSCAV